jgi:hypothetical protein
VFEWIKEESIRHGTAFSLLGEQAEQHRAERDR